MPGAYQAVYNGTKAFLDSFSYALREELKDTGVTVTCLMPGATETDFFDRADMLDTKVGTTEKDSPVDVAKDGFKAMMAGDGGIVSGSQNKMQIAIAQRGAGRDAGAATFQDGEARHRGDQSMSGGKDDNSDSETNEPWKLPGQSSQQPEQKPPPKRDPDEDYPKDRPAG